MKKILVISDSFKGTLSSLDICAIARQTVPKIFPDCTVVPLPIADGGEGTVDCFIEAVQAEPVTVTVSGPFGESVHARYARKGSCAFIEMAAAAGLPLVGENRDPTHATTYGVGQLIHHAILHGCTQILLGIGGSCTNDGGCGCAAALGVVFYKHDGQSFLPVGDTLDQIASIDVSAADQLLSKVSITVMCDVQNPLHGENGAAYIFAPQKGADDKTVIQLDENLKHLDRIVQKCFDKALAGLLGAGAAGGLGYGCVVFLHAVLKSGIEAALDAVGFDQHLTGTDLVITGEGRIDSQSVHGKTISGIAKRVKPTKIPLVAIVGCIAPDADEAYDLGVSAIFSINREAEDFATSAPKSQENYRKTLEDILRLCRALPY